RSGRAGDRSRCAFRRSRDHAWRRLHRDVARPADRGTRRPIMSAVAAPADRRFRRAHVKPSRTRRRWVGRVRPLLRYALAAAVVAYGLYFGSSRVAHAHVLRVDRILVRGNEWLSQGEVLAVLSGLRGESLVWTDLDRWRQRLLA